jgi:hypothetical protein
MKTKRMNEAEVEENEESEEIPKIKYKFLNKIYFPIQKIY